MEDDELTGSDLVVEKTADDALAVGAAVPAAHGAGRLVASSMSSRVAFAGVVAAFVAVAAIGHDGVEDFDPDTLLEQLEEMYGR